MTAQVNVGSSSKLVTLAFGVNELASSFIVAKHVGSILSRPQDAQIFNIFESRFNVRVKLIPEWLQDVTFSRTAMVHGEHMCCIKESDIMKGVSIHRLEGIASLVVLATKYTENKEEATKLLELLLLGGLGSSVDKGDLEGQSLPYSLKPMLRPFVEATLQSDAESSQAKNALSWISELSMITGCLKKTKRFARNRQMTINMMSELLGGASMKEEHQTQRGIPLIPPSNDVGRVFDTFGYGPAYIALAARANGVDAVVEVVQSKDTKIMLPRTSRPGPKTFIVRLWLCQPPLEVRSILRYSESLLSANYMNGVEPNEFDDDEEMTVFGGKLELSTWAARKVNFDGSSLQNHIRQSVTLKLWNEGRQLVKNCKWMTRKVSRWQSPLRFQLDVSSISENPIPAVASDLAKLFDQKHEQLVMISRPIANIVHQTYNFDSYVLDDDDSLTRELMAAMDLVAISVSIHSLHMITNLPETDNGSQYALNLATLNKGGAIHDLLLQALSSNGIAIQKLLWAVATLWGGASHKTQGSSLVDDTVFAIVAPHCTALMDILRDPLHFICTGISSKLLTVCRGAVPMLPRDPRTGFLKIEQHDGEKSTIVVPVQHSTFPTNLQSHIHSSISSNMQFPTSSTSSPTKLKVQELDHTSSLSELVITFEPVLMNPSRGLFCAWYMGSLVFELNPSRVFVNVLKRSLESNQADPGENRCTSPSAITLTQLDLLEKGHFEVEGGYGIFDCYGKPGWAVAIAGLASTRAFFCRGKLDHIPETLGLESGDVLIVCNLED